MIFLTLILASHVYLFKGSGYFQPMPLFSIFQYHSFSTLISESAGKKHAPRGQGGKSTLLCLTKSEKIKWIQLAMKDIFIAGVDQLYKCEHAEVFAAS